MKWKCLICGKEIKIGEEYVEVTVLLNVLKGLSKKSIERCVNKEMPIAVFHKDCADDVHKVLLYTDRNLPMALSEIAKGGK
jgi:hypothetical protein